MTAVDGVVFRIFLVLMLRFRLKFLVELNWAGRAGAYGVKLSGFADQGLCPWTPTACRRCR